MSERDLHDRAGELEPAALRAQLRMLPQGTYSFRHDTLGEFLLFIVPVVGSNDERIVYEACFNRRVAEPSAP
jgi:hypothetical protein